ncbi:MAG: TPM domain-containing protein [Sphingomonas sp.]|nr:TPM domain-containing protein [Sphingomonas sp.]
MGLILAFLAALLLFGSAATAQTFPKFTGLVVDAANVLPPETKADLTAKLEALQKETGRQLVVATIPDLQGYPIEDYGYRLGRAWGVGLKDVNNGAILFIAPNEPKGHRGPRIEVGYGLEPYLTDAFSSQVIRDIMVPQLKAGDVPGAMTAGTDALIAQLRANPDEAKARTDAAIKEFDKARKKKSSGTAAFGIGAGVIFWLLVVGFIVLASTRRRMGRAYRSGGSDWGSVALWTALEVARAAAENNNRGSGWGGGGSGGGGGSDGGWGGGGFSGGGGGSFGGGGASGDW